MMKPQVTDRDEASKTPKSLPERLDGFLKISKSIYAVIAALAAIILATTSDAKHTRFTIYLISRMWIEALLISSCWCAFLFLKWALRSERLARISFRFSDFLDPRVMVTAFVVLLAVLSFVPPIYYFSKLRYRFWSSQVLPSYVEGVKNKVDEQSNEGRLNTALNTLILASDVLKGTAQQDRLKERQIELTAAVNRSRQLDQSTINSWNFVTERSKWFALVEAVRINPENSNAADRLRTKLNNLRDALASDAQQICSQTNLPSSFSGRAVAGIEARSLWNRYSSGAQCFEHVQAELNDGWGLGPIACILEQNQEIRQNSTLENNTASCPPGIDFWTPLGTSDDEPPIGLSNDQEENRLSYPSIIDIFKRWRVRQLAKAEQKKILEKKAKLAAQIFDIHLETLPHGSIGIHDFQENGNTDWSNSYIDLLIPDANLQYRYKLSDSFTVPMLHLHGGLHSYSIRSEIHLNNVQKDIEGSCEGNFGVGDGESLQWAINLSADGSIGDCGIGRAR